MAPESTPELRDAVPADAWSIAELHVASWRVAYRGLIADEVLAGLSVPDRAAWWSCTLATADARHTVVLTERGTLRGFAAFGPDRDERPLTGELYALYLHPDCWGRGFGRRLHAAALDGMRARGYGQARLWVLAGNERALRFYRRAGWTDDGRVERASRGDGVALDHRGLSRLLDAVGPA